MSEMVERVARGMFARNSERIHVSDTWEGANDYVRKGWQDLARAAIEAMRVPTDAMRIAGIDKRHPVQNDNAEDPAAPWGRMIDDALNVVPIDGTE